MSHEPPSRCRVLVVDDDEGIRTLLEVSISLDPRFALAGSARDAAQALTIAADAGGAVDAVLLDVTLPDRNGIDLVGELRALLPHAGIALFTGWSDDPSLLARADEAGADAVYRKDLPPPELLEGLAALCTPLAPTNA